MSSLLALVFRAAGLCPPMNMLLSSDTLHSHSWCTANNLAIFNRFFFVLSGLRYYVLILFSLKWIVVEFVHLLGVDAVGKLTVEM